MHGGVAGVGRQLPPLCRSNGVFAKFGSLAVLAT
jgi:hypothetical protein